MRQALRHAGINPKLQAIKVQREPFEAKGKRAELFAGSRFAKERLWHVEIALVASVPGPMPIGDGRYLGLGLMAPIPHLDGIWSFAILDGLAKQVDLLELTRALRRSVMARVQPRSRTAPGFGNRTRIPANACGSTRGFSCIVSRACRQASVHQGRACNAG